MKDEDRILLMFGWAVLVISIILFMCKITYKIDEIEKKIDAINKDAVIVTETATPTEASIRPEYLRVNNKPEASEMNFKGEDEQIDLEELKSIPEASEGLTEATLGDAEAICEAVICEPEEQDLIVPFKDHYTYLGSYELTAYAWTGNRCANGNYPSCGYTIASNSIPMGSRVYIEGYGEYVVEDRGGMAGNVIDVYMGDYDTCIQFGRQTADVYLIN